VGGGAILITHDDGGSPAVHDEIQEAAGVYCFDSVYSLDAGVALIPPPLYHQRLMLLSVVVHYRYARRCVAYSESHCISHMR